MTRTYLAMLALLAVCIIVNPAGVVAIPAAVAPLLGSAEMASGAAPRSLADSALLRLRNRRSESAGASRARSYPITPSRSGRSAVAAEDVCNEFMLPVIDGRQLLLDRTDDAFVLRSFAYRPTPICEYPGSDADTAYIDPRLIQRDGPWMTDAGGNAIRIYEALYTDGSTSSIGTTHEYIQAAACEDLWVIMGSEIDPPAGTKFSDEAFQKQVIEAHVSLVQEFESEPNILMWAVGNEVNGHIDPCTSENLDAWCDLLDGTAQAIKAEQGGSGPGVGPYVTSVIGDLNCDLISRGLVDLDACAPNVDIWGINVYRGSSFHTLFDEVLANTRKPFWIGETGIDSWDHDAGHEDQTAQANYLKALWAQVEKNCDVVFGGDMAFYSDEWWKHNDEWPPVDPSPCKQDPGGSPFGCGPDDYLDEEYLGVMRIEPDASGIDVVQPKKAYHALDLAWADTTPKPCDPKAPFQADFNAPDCHGQCSNNYAGVSFGFYLRGNPPFQDDGEVQIDCREAGVTEGTGDTALHVAGTVETGADFTVFLSAVTLFPEVGKPRNSDLSSFDRLSFHAKRGGPTAHAPWKVRLEDSSNSPVFERKIEASEAYQHECVKDFAELPTPDLRSVAQIVFEAADIPPGPAQAEMDLVIDNLAIFSSKSHDADADCVPNWFDNCTERENVSQGDSDDDGFGNACDCDFNQDGGCGQPDYSTFIACFGKRVPASGPADDPTCEESDMNGDGGVGQPDYSLFIRLFGGMPGPSGTR